MRKCNLCDAILQVDTIQCRSRYRTDACFAESVLASKIAIQLSTATAVRTPRPHWNNKYISIPLAVADVAAVVAIELVGAGRRRLC